MIHLTNLSTNDYDSFTKLLMIFQNKICVTAIQAINVRDLKIKLKVDK